MSCRAAAKTALLFGVSLLLARGAAAGEGVWTGAGPSPGRVDWVGVIPGSPPVLLVRAYGGDFLRSTDEGTTWTSIDGARAGEQLFTTPGDSLVAPPGSPGTAYRTLGAVTSTPRVLKTTDSGASWAELGIRANCVSGSAQRPEVLYAGGQTTVAKTTDSGATWVEGDISAARYFVFSMAVDPVDDDVVYAGDETGTILRSTTGGLDFEVAVPGGNDTTAPVRFITAFTGPDGRSRVYAESVGTLVASTDGGASWQKVVQGLPGYLFSFLPLATDGSDLLAGTSRGLFRSTDSGGTWERALAGSEWAGVRTLTRDPSPGGALYAATYSGLLVSKDSGASWSRVGSRPALDVWKVAGDAGSSRTLFTGGSGGLFRTTDDGATWTALQGLEHDWILSLATLPSRPATVLAGTRHGLFTSTDGGTSWRAAAGFDSGGGPAPPQPGYIVAIAPAPSSRRVAYAADGDSYVYRSTDQGVTWAVTSPFPLAPPFYVGDLAVDPRDEDVVYAFAYGDFYKSTDAGASWVGGFGVGSRYAAGTLAVDAADPARIFIGSTEGLWRTTNGGATWKLLDGVPAAPFTGPLVSGVVADRATGRVFVSADLGTFESTDGGDTWAAFGSLPAGAIARALARSPADPSKLFCGTITDGAFALTIPGYPVTHGDANADGRLDALDVFALVNFLFGDGPPPQGIPDANGDGTIDVADVFYLINHLFAGGPAPV